VGQAAIVGEVLNSFLLGSIAQTLVRQGTGAEGEVGAIGGRVNGSTIFPGP
jgi:hypothetical protein